MHEELAWQWISSTGAAREMAFLNAWFFLELILKSMAEYLNITNRLYLPRKLHFSEGFIQNLNALSYSLIGEVIQRLSKDPRQSQCISASWAFFLRDCFTLMDRSYVMKLVKEYNQELTSKMTNLTESSAMNLILLKLDFMRIISSHEHFIVLNLPFGSGAFSKGMSKSHSGLSFSVSFIFHH